MFYAGEIVEIHGFANLGEVIEMLAPKDKAQAPMVRIAIAGFEVTVPQVQVSLASSVQTANYLEKLGSKNAKIY